VIASTKRRQERQRRTEQDDRLEQARAQHRGRVAHRVEVALAGHRHGSADDQSETGRRQQQCRGPPLFPEQPRHQTRGGPGQAGEDHPAADRGQRHGPLEQPGSHLPSGDELGHGRIGDPPQRLQQQLRHLEHPPSHADQAERFNPGDRRDRGVEALLTQQPDGRDGLEADTEAEQVADPRPREPWPEPAGRGRPGHRDHAYRGPGRRRCGQAPDPGAGEHPAERPGVEDQDLHDLDGRQPAVLQLPLEHDPARDLQRE
jgi:hypothetical protein